MTDVVVLGDSDSSGDDEVVEVVRDITTAPAAGARARDRAGAQKRPRGVEPGNGNARGSGATAPPGRARGRGARAAAEEPEVRITNEDVLVKREKAAQHLGRMVPGEVEARAAGRGGTVLANETCIRIEVAELGRIAETQNPDTRAPDPLTRLPEPSPLTLNPKP